MKFNRIKLAYVWVTVGIVNKKTVKIVLPKFLRVQTSRRIEVWQKVNRNIFF